EEDVRHGRRRQHRPGGRDLQRGSLRGRGGPLRRRGRARQNVLSPTRPVFQSLTDWEIALWYCLVGVSTAIFLAGVFLLVRKYRRGRTAAVPTDWSLRRLGRAGWIVLSHAWIKRRDG